MPKWILYIVILLLTGFIAYLVYGKELFDTETSTESNIEVSPATITKSKPATSTEAAAEESADEALIAISGRLARFEEAPDRSTGSLIIYALIDDGTEFITVDMRDVVKPGVSAPEDQLGLELGQAVTVRGFVVADGAFRVKEIE